MSNEEKNKIEEVIDMLNDLPVGLHISQNETMLSAYTRAIELLEQKRIGIRNALVKLNEIWING